MSTQVDIVIVGSGFGGSLMAMIARRLGYSVALLERGRHPRFAIGESSTPLADLLWRELTERYSLPRLTPLSKWGSWQAAYPQMACGLKRGFTFLHHTQGQPFTDDATHDHQLLVAASSRDASADTHWYRPDFDQFLVNEAQASGVEYVDELNLTKLETTADGVTLSGEKAGRTMGWSARFLIDASGPRGFLFRALGLPEAPWPHLPPTEGLYTHFRGVKRIEELGWFAGQGTPPYPPDDAALHHVFDGGWIWVLRFNQGITSAGVAVTQEAARQLRLADGAPGWQRLLDRLPSVREQFEDATAVLPFVHAPQLPFRCGRISGPRWALLPFAAGFIDPLLSTGFPLTLLGISRLAAALEGGLDEVRLAPGLADYARNVENETAAAEKLVASLYAHFRDFPLFRELSLLYFAAAGYTELSRRLGRPGQAGGFLMHDHPRFGPALDRCCDLALAPDRNRIRPQLSEAIRLAISDFDVLGLSCEDRRHWYPVQASDLLASAGKLHATTAEMERLIAS